MTEPKETPDVDRDVRVGNARVPWGNRSRIGHPEGWVLPCGGRTIDFNRAHAVACILNDCLKTYQPPRTK